MIVFDELLLSRGSRIARRLFVPVLCLLAALTPSLLRASSVSITISPTSATVVESQTESFKATVAGSTNVTVTWSASCGTVTGTGSHTATFTAPALATNCTVTATSAANTAKTAQATVTVVPPVAIRVTPLTANLLAGGTQTFTATVSNTTNLAVNWSANCGSLSSRTANPVTYTAPNATEACTVTAKSSADTTKTAAANVNVTVPVSITLSPTAVKLNTNATQTFTAKVAHSSNTAVSWSASCGSLASITANPVTYTAPAGATTCKVTATSAADGSKSAQASVTVVLPVTISVAPSPVSLLTNGTQSFTATVSNTSNTAVSWRASCGSLSSTTANPVTYTAPGTAKTCTVTATSVADPTKAAQATVTVTAPVTISVDPSSASLLTNAARTFTATVKNTTNTAVSWSASCGSLSSSTANPVTYTAPASATTCTVTATSAADGSKSAHATVTVTAPVTISVTPPAVSLLTGGTQSFSATVGNTTNTAVTWSRSCGSLSSSTANPVTYTAPGTANTCTVTATSVADHTKSAQATVTVTAPVTISVDPKNITLQANGTHSFTATVKNTTNTAVTWSASCGSLSSTSANPVTYTAPGSATSCTVTATSAADGTKSAQANVTVNPPAPVSVSVTPPSVSLQPSGTQSFTATVSNTTNTAVTWGASCGTLSSTTANPVNYTAPSIDTTCTVTATSVADGTKSGQATVTVATTTNVNVSISPASSSIPVGGTAQITATVTGSSNTGVTWSSGSVSGDPGTITGTGNTIQFTSTSTGIATLTATANADNTQSASAQILVTPTGVTYPAVPYPISAHPRLWITPADVTRLQGWANESNPVYVQGMLPVLQTAVTNYTTQFFPGGVPNPNWPDPGDVQGYQGLLAEENALILAFNSLIDPNPANRILYAQYARNLIMYAMNQAALGQEANAPYRDPAFPVYNRGSATGQNWPLVVDWIYNTVDADGHPILTAQDKATIRNVFLIWAADCVTASTTGGDSPQVQGVINDPQLLPNNLPYRMAANNYYLAHAKLMTMMALAIDPGDDAVVAAGQPATMLGNTLRSYLNDAVGAWLYQEYAMFGDAQTVTSAYGIPGNGAGFGLASGGLPPEGMLYGESLGTALGQLLALQTAGFNDPAYADFTGPQIGLIGAPIWGRWVNGMLTSLIPTSFVPASEPYLGPVYEFASYGDMLRLWVEPDNVSAWTTLDLLENQNGQTTHQADVRWFATNVLQGGAAGLADRMTSSTWGAIATIEYYLLLDPAAPAAPDPRPGLPLEFHDPGAGRIVAHSDWTPNNTLFDYHASWESINHQDGNAGEFELFRKGEWLTKEMSNYDNNEVGLTTYYHNTLGLKNWCPAGTPDLGWEEGGEWANGSQWILDSNAGDPVTLTSSGTGYVFATTDMTNLYNRPDPWDDTQNATNITRAQRSILWLNKDYIVVYDRATSINSGLFKRFNLSLVTSPAITGLNATETMTDGQQLFIHTLLPQSATITSREADTDLSPIADLEPTKYVMTVEDTGNPTDIRFLHVLQGADAGAKATAVSGFTTTSGTVFDGALVGNSALLFIHDDTQTAGFGTTVYSEPATVTANYVAGLRPGGAYTVSKSTTGGTVQVTVTAGGSSTADAAGMLVF